MKKTLLITLLLIVGCSKEPINIDTLKVDSIGYFNTRDTDEPYSGPVFSLYYDANTYPDGKKKAEGFIKYGHQDGKWTFWYENGQMKEEGSYNFKENGGKDGKWTLWYENGQMKEEGSYSWGDKDGAWTYWYRDGQKKRENTYEYEKEIESREWYYYENGQKKSEKTYKNGEIDGLWTDWYENGQKKREMIYKNGQPWDGKIEERSSLGAPFDVEYTEKTYKEGKEIWKKEFGYYGPDSLNAQKEFVRNYKNGKEDGLWTDWYENGQKKREGPFKNGGPNGLTTMWYENGQLKGETNYKDGKQDGLTKTWYENGQKTHEGNYKNGKYDGFWTNWYENGQKKKEGNQRWGQLDGQWTYWHKNGKIEKKKTFKAYDPNKCNPSSAERKALDWIESRYDIRSPLTLMMGDGKLNEDSIWRFNCGGYKKNYKFGSYKTIIITISCEHASYDVVDTQIH
jgi:antitoxin component YwqK of YwqJK toxin-antitoxin module